MKNEKKVRAQYVDGFLLSVPKRKLPAYRLMSQKAGKIWLEYGALDYVECVGDDMEGEFGISFIARVKSKRGEVPVFSWITYKSKSDRDKVNGKVMKDPRLAKMMDPKKMPFDPKLMTYGGFKVLVNL
ncbi:MAG: DUF1428 domain-containing protein [Ignavibacteria bacterium]